MEIPSWCFAANLLVKKYIAKSSLGYFFQKIESDREDVKYGKLFLVAEDGFIDLGLMLSEHKFAISNDSLFMKRIGANCKSTDFPSTASNSIGCRNDNLSSATEGRDKPIVKDSVELQGKKTRKEQERTQKSVQPVRKLLEEKETVEDKQKLAHNNAQKINPNQGLREFSPHAQTCKKDRERHFDTQDKVYRNNNKGMKFSNRVQELQESSPKPSSISSATLSSRKTYPRIPEDETGRNDETIEENKSKTFRERNWGKSSGNFGKKANFQKFARTKRRQTSDNEEEHLRENKPSAGPSESSDYETGCEDVTRNARFFRRDKDTRNGIQPKGFESSRTSNMSQGYSREKLISGKKDSLLTRKTSDEDTACNFSSAERDVGKKSFSREINVDSAIHPESYETSESYSYNKSHRSLESSDKNKVPSKYYLLPTNETSKKDTLCNEKNYRRDVRKKFVSPEKSRGNKIQQQNLKSPRSYNGSMRSEGNLREKSFSTKSYLSSPNNSFDEDVPSKNISPAERNVERKFLSRGATNSSTTHSEDFEISGRYDETSRSFRLPKETKVSPRDYLVVDHEISDKNTSPSKKLSEEAVEKKGIVPENDSENAIQSRRGFKVNRHILSRNIPINDSDKEKILDLDICDVDYVFYDEKNVSKISVSVEKDTGNKSNSRNFVSNGKDVSDRFHQFQENKFSGNSDISDNSETFEHTQHDNKFTERNVSRMSVFSDNETFDEPRIKEDKMPMKFIPSNKIQRKSESFEQIIVQSRSLECYEEERNDIDHDSSRDDGTLEGSIHHTKFVEGDGINSNLALHSHKVGFSNSDDTVVSTNETQEMIRTESFVGRKSLEHPRRDTCDWKTSPGSGLHSEVGENSAKFSGETPLQEHVEGTESELPSGFISSVNRKTKPKHVLTYYPAGFNMQEADRAFNRLKTNEKCESGSSHKSNCLSNNVDDETLNFSHKNVKAETRDPKSAHSGTDGCSKFKSEDCGKRNKFLKQTNIDLEKKLIQSSISEIDNREEYEEVKSPTYDVEKSTDNLSTSQETDRKYLPKLDIKVDTTERMRELQLMQNCQKVENSSECKSFVVSKNVLSSQPNVIEETFIPCYSKQQMQKDAGEKTSFSQPSDEHETKEIPLSPEHRLLSAIKEYVAESDLGRISENNACASMLQQLIQNLSGISEKEGLSNLKERESNTKDLGGLEISKVKTTEKAKMISSIETQEHLQMSCPEIVGTRISSVEVSDVQNGSQRVAGESIQCMQVTMTHEDYELKDTESAERLHNLARDTVDMTRADDESSVLRDSIETREVQTQPSKLVQVQDIKCASEEIWKNVSERGILKEDLETANQRDAKVKEDLRDMPQEDRNLKSVTNQNVEAENDGERKTMEIRNLKAKEDGEHVAVDDQKLEDYEKHEVVEDKNLETLDDGKNEVMEDKNLETLDDGKNEVMEDKNFVAENWKCETVESQNLVTKEGENIVSKEEAKILTEEQSDIATVYIEDEHVKEDESTDVISEEISEATVRSNGMVEETRNNEAERLLGIKGDQKIETENKLKQFQPIETEEDINAVLEGSQSVIAEEVGKTSEVEADGDLDVRRGPSVEAETEMHFAVGEDINVMEDRSSETRVMDLEIKKEDSDVVARETPLNESAGAEVSFKSQDVSEKKDSKTFPVEENVVEIGSRTETEKYLETMTGGAPEESEEVTLRSRVSDASESAQATSQTTVREILQVSQTAYHTDKCSESKTDSKDIFENKSTMPESSSSEECKIETPTCSSTVTKGNTVEKTPISKENNLSGNARDTSTKSNETQGSGKAPSHRSINVNPDPCSNLVLNTGRKIMDQLQLMTILLHGAPEGFRHFSVISDAAFRIDIHETLKTIMNRLMRIQKYSWPLIQQGYSVIMIGPPMSGKTLGYVVPLVDMVMQNVHCNQIPKGNGPVSIILCSGSKSCNEIGEICDLFIRKSAKPMKVLVAYGGGAEKGIEFKLINGCHILITTPRCFKRLIAFGKVVMNFHRLKYLVLDEADVLTLRFLPEVEFICKSVERDMKPQDKAQLQVVAAAEKWCPGLEGLVRSLSKPVVCIGAFMEALIYAHLKPHVHFVTQGSRTAVLQEIVEKSALKHRTLIVCQDVTEVEGVTEALRPYPQLLSAHDNMDTSDIHEVYVKWSWMKRPALVCTDVILQEMRIQGASQVVHFSLGAVSKREFAFRCSALIDQLPSMFENKEKKETQIEPQMHIFISDMDSEPLPTLVSFLKRLGTPVDPDLQKRANAADVTKEMRKDCVPLCYNTKAFGDCWNRSKCVYRHVISSKDIPQNIPVSGTVKVKILYIHDTCNYSTRIVEHVNENGKVEAIPNRIMSLARKLESYFKEEGHRILLENPKAHDICASEKPVGIFHRTEVLAITKADRFGRPTQLLVRYIDDGCRDLINADKVFLLPEDIKNIPPQSVELFLCRLVPCDFDWSWGMVTNDKLTSILSEAQVKGRFLVGKIRLSLGHMLWVDPLECFESLPTLKTSTIVFSLRRKLLNEMLAVENPQHLHLLYQACARGGIEVACNRTASDTSSQISKLQDKQNINWAHLPVDEFSLVYFIVGDHPGRFYMRQKKFEDLVHKLDKKLLKIVNEKNATNRTLFTGDYCIGRFPTDDRWYRARVENAQDDSLDLFFVDHGDRASISRSEAIPLPKNLVSQLPFQAIECCFAGVSPDMGDRWSEKSIDALYGITAKPGTVDGVKLLYAKVLQKVKPADCTGGYKYHIALIEVTSHGRAMLNDTLVAWGVASQSDEQKLLLKSVDFSHLPPPVDLDPYESEEDEKEEEPCSLDDVNITIEENWDDSLVETSFSTGDVNTSINTSQSFSPDVSSSSETSVVPAVLSGFNFDEVTKDEIMEFFEKTMESYKAEKDKQSSVNTTFSTKEDEKEEEREKEKESKANTSAFQETSKSPKKDQGPRTEFTKNEKDVENIGIKPLNICDNSNSSIDDDMEECSSGLDDDDDDCVMPPLLRTTRVPLVYWHQNAYFVWLRVDLPGVEKYHLKWDIENLHFWTMVEDLVYTFDLNLFGPIDPHSLKHSGGLFVRIKMQKVVHGTDWLRLTVERKKLQWIKRDYNEENDSDIEDLHLSEQLRAVKEMEKKTVARTHRGGLLPADEAPYEEGDEDEDTDSNCSDVLLPGDEQYDPYDPMN